jgi:hypothetical protein
MRWWIESGPRAATLTWAYGFGVFDLEPGIDGGKTPITVNYYHAAGADRTPTPQYELFETLVPAKDRRRTG